AVADIGDPRADSVGGGVGVALHAVVGGDHAFGFGEPARDRGDGRLVVVGAAAGTVEGEDPGPLAQLHRTGHAAAVVDGRAGGGKVALNTVRGRPGRHPLVQHVHHPAD